MKVEEKYEDVLQNIEFAVVSFDKKSMPLRDEHCLKAYDLLKKKYIGEMRGWKLENTVIEGVVSANPRNFPEHFLIDSRI